jgi:cobalt ECF transporter T component CbiQ
MGFNELFQQNSKYCEDVSPHAGGRPPCRGLYRWDPRQKIVLLILVVALNVCVAELWLSFFLLAAGVGCALGSGLSLRLFGLFFLAPAWATLIVFLGFSVGFGVSPFFSIGPLTVYREGFHQGLAAAARVACDMAWIASVFLTTPFNALMEALRWFRVPPILLDIIAIAFRYAGLIREEFQRMKTSALTRGGFRNYSSSYQSLARILSQIILRSYDRALRIQQAMLARGESGQESVSAAYRASRTDDSCPNRCDITPIYGNGSAPVLACTDVSHSYADTRSLKRVSLTVQRGEVVVLCGPNGAGKSTLLRLFAGILSPDSGDIRLCGRKLDRGSRKEAFRKAGILFQDPNDQVFCTHVREDIAYGPTNLGFGAAEVDRLVSTAMELMEISHLSTRPIHKLSHGELRRVGLAGVLAMQPPLILLDEPTSSLDPASAQHFISLIRHLNSHHGYTLIIVTHDINIASMIATRVVILNNGEVVADGSARAILTNRALLEDSRLEPPLLTKLFQQLNGGAQDQSIPLTIEEAVERLKQLETRGELVSEPAHPGRIGLQNHDPGKSTV